jgi:pentalenolactone synthase
MINSDELPRLPFGTCPLLGIAPQLRELQRAGPVVRIITPAGDEAWLVTRYREVKALFADQRLGYSHPHPARAARMSNSPLADPVRGSYAAEDADHARMRSRLAPCFSARRMRAFKPEVDRFVDELLAELADRPAPRDLHAELSFPLPVRAVCALFGIPYADRTWFREWSAAMTDFRDRQAAIDARREMFTYLHRLVGRKRADPGDDAISELISAEDGTLTDSDIARLTMIALFAGHKSTMERIDIGVPLILANPRQRDVLRAPAPPIAAMVEEILRLGTGASGGGAAAQHRYARTDIEVCGVTIRQGDAVMLSITAANRDERAFAEPDRFDITRPADNAHLSFGYGARYCAGATLARVMLTSVFERLFLRFPTLELAVPVDDLVWPRHLPTGGLVELPVQW